jgi:hypothetical protein
MPAPANMAMVVLVQHDRGDMSDNARVAMIAVLTPSCTVPDGMILPLPRFQLEEKSLYGMLILPYITYIYNTTI